MDYFKKITEVGVKIRLHHTKIEKASETIRGMLLERGSMPSNKISKDFTQLTGLKGVVQMSPEIFLLSGKGGTVFYDFLRRL